MPVTIDQSRCNHQFVHARHTNRGDRENCKYALCHDQNATCRLCGHVYVAAPKRRNEQGDTAQTAA